MSQRGSWGCGPIVECYPSSFTLTAMAILRIDVPTPSRRYPIVLGDGLLDQLSSQLDEAGAPSRRFVVSSPRVWKLHGERFALASSAEVILVPDGERYK